MVARAQRIVRERPERWLPVVGYEGHYEVSSLGRNGNTHQTEEQVRVMRQLRHNGASLQELSDIYRVSISRVSETCNRKFWIHVE